MSGPVEAEVARLLENPVWSSLTQGHRALAEGGPLARRFPAEVSPFAAVSEPSGVGFEALRALVPAEDQIALVRAEPFEAPPPFVTEMRGTVLQMILGDPFVAVKPGPEPVVLGAADIGEMLDLTARTRPGPFGPRTIEFGGYIGLRLDGALVAMAGERMRFGEFAEISAVCVDPAHQGRGYATLLMERIARRIQERGQTPFLHVFSDNAGAIALYEKLGFVGRRRLHMAVLRHAAG